MSSVQNCFTIFSCPEQLNRTHCLSLACLLALTKLTIRVFTTLQSEPRDLWPLRHLIRVMRRHDLTKKDLPTYLPTYLPTSLENTIQELVCQWHFHFACVWAAVLFYTLYIYIGVMPLIRQIFVPHFWPSFLTLIFYPNFLPSFFTLIFYPNFLPSFFILIFDPHFSPSFFTLIFDNLKDSTGDLTFETLITILTIENLNSDNHSYLTINCDTGQHSQFLRCFDHLPIGKDLHTK